MKETAQISQSITNDIELQARFPPPAGGAAAINGAGNGQQQQEPEYSSMSTSVHSAEETKIATEETNLMSAIRNILVKEEIDRDPYTLIFKDAKLENDFQIQHYQIGVTTSRYLILQVSLFNIVAFLFTVYDCTATGIGPQTIPIISLVAL